MNALRKAFDRGKILIPYITAGDPDLETTAEIIKELDKMGVGIIEVGMPFSDPLADGPVIQAASQRALAKGETIPKIFEMLNEIKGHISTPIVLMGYFNPIIKYGEKSFVQDALACNVSGILIPDLPFDEGKEFYDLCLDQGLCPIYMVTPNTKEDRLTEIGKVTKGFLYCVSLLGITGDKRGPIEEIKTYMERVRARVSAPLALGFGIDSPEKVKAVKNYTDGIVIGSAIVNIIAENSSLGREALKEEISTFTSTLLRVLKEPLCQ
ncbi:MAG: tryptophan synthase subunit alpha [Acetomicrobium sp.]